MTPLLAVLALASGGWWSEGGEKIWAENGRIFIKADNPAVPGGAVATVWFRQPHPADFQLDVDAHVISSTIGANNINLFFCYTDPAGRPLEETRETRRNAEYDLYHKLNGYIVTFLNDAGTARVRMRRNPGFQLMNEVHRGQCRAGETYHLRVVKRGGAIEFWVDGEKMLEGRDPQPLGEGLLGLRTYRTYLWWDNLKVSRRP